MRREDVEALMHEARESGGSIGHVDATHLYALCRRWLAVEDAPQRMVGDGISYGVSVAGTGIPNGSRVRIVPEAGQGVGK